MPSRRRRTMIGLVCAAATVAGCGWHTSPVSTGARPEPGITGVTGVPADVLAGARPIGRGPRFQPPARGAVVGTCHAALARRDGVHLEVFAANRVVVVAAGIGVRHVLRRAGGRIAAAACFGAIVTVEPTGVLLVRPGGRLHLADAFRAWGQPLGPSRMAGFVAPRGDRVRVWVGGRPWRGSPGSVPLTRHAEIVVEVGPYVLPHRMYTFPPGV